MGTAAPSDSTSINFSDDAASPLLPAGAHSSLTIPAKKKSGLTAFEGVFVPCVLSIFSVVLFLRLGYIVGQSGLAVCLGMLLVSYFVVFLTILSISGIATNGLIRGGGAYYMISRSLGPEFGGAIGVIFYFANIFSSGLYIVGFVEALHHNVEALPSGQWYLFACGSGVLLFCLVVCIIGAKAFAKTSLLIFAAVMVSVLSVLLNFTYAKEQHSMGCPRAVEEGPSNMTCPGDLAYTRFSTKTLQENMDPAWSVDYTTGEMQDLRDVFAVLFNGCTGIMAGANMSGDLKDASVSIPYGTIGASAFTFLVYVILFTLSAGSCNRDLLLYDYSYLSDISVVPALVIVGIFSATLSAALSCLIGASRIIQAISRDRLLGEWSSFFASEEGEPIRALFLSWFLVQMVLFIGQINVIAPIVSMLYLISYAITNFACFALSVSGAPNFRPTFRYFSWHTALLGFLGCMFVMFYVNTPYAGLTVAFAVLLWVWIHVRHIPVEWGDVSQALMYHQVRKYLLQLRPDAALGKYWRPQIMFMTVNPRYNFEALRFVNEQKKGGLLVLGRVLVGNLDSVGPIRHGEEVNALLDLARCSRLKMFAEVAIASSVRQGSQDLLLCSGLGTMRPNTIFLGFYGESTREDQLVPYRDKLKTLHSSLFVQTPTRTEFDEMCSQFPVATNDGLDQNQTLSPDEYVGILHDALRFSKSVGIVKNMGSISRRLEIAQSRPAPCFIDIWPLTMSHVQSYELMLQLAQILHSTRRWRKTKIRVFCISSARSADAEVENMKNVLKSLRIQAQIEQVTSQTLNPQRLEDLDLQTCIEVNALMKSQTGTVHMYSHLPEPPDNLNESQDYIRRLRALTEELPPVTLVRGAEFVTTHHAEAV